MAHRFRELAQKNYRQRGSAGFVPVVCSSWTEQPVLELIRQIEFSVGTLFPEGDRPVLPERLDLAIAAASQLVDAKLLIMLDQFEEYSLYRPGDPSQGLLLEQLAFVINQPDIRANFLISIREDAYASLGDLFRGRIPNLYSNYLSLSKLRHTSANEAIRKPIDRYNELYRSGSPVEIEDGLVDEVLRQVGTGRISGQTTGVGSLERRSGSDEIEAPYLQLVMTRLWQTEQTAWVTGSPGRRVLRRSTLDELGGADEIVRTHLDVTLEELPAKDRDLAADVFHHLVTPSGAKIAQNAFDLADYTHHSSGEVETVLERLVKGDARVLRKVDETDGDRGGAKFEIYHDVLAPAILGWRQHVETDRLKRRVRHAHRLLVLTICVVLLGIGAFVGVWHLTHEQTPADELRALVPVQVGVTCKSVPIDVKSAIAEENCNWVHASTPINDMWYWLYPQSSDVSREFSNDFLPQPLNKMGKNPCGPYNTFVNNCVLTYGPRNSGFGLLWENFLGSGKNRYPTILASSTRGSLIFELDGSSGSNGNDLMQYFNDETLYDTNGFVNSTSHNG